jgi:hypothetical protein
MLLSFNFSASIRVSVLRVLAVVGYLALSRALAIYTAMTLIKAEAPLIVNCGYEERGYIENILTSNPEALAQLTDKDASAETTTAQSLGSRQIVEQPAVAESPVLRGNIPASLVCMYLYTALLTQMCVSSLSFPA